MSPKPSRLDPARFFQALADPTRLRLLNLLRDSEICVCYLVEVLDQPQPKISRHLAHLRAAGIVSARRDGKWMHYRISAPLPGPAARVLKRTLAWLEEDKSMQRDCACLDRACCSPQKSPALQGAPVPCSAVSL